MRKGSLLFILLAAALVALSGCAKPECKSNSDCMPKKCFLAKCEDGKCSYSAQSNCCGNKIAESTEDAKPGDKCTCPADYGKCEGKGIIKIGSKTEDARYMHYYCSEGQKCVLGLNKEDALPQNFLDMINPGLFKASAIEKYNMPFDTAGDAFEYEITLDDVHNSLLFPIELTKIRLLFNREMSTELLIAEQDLGAEKKLNKIGDKIIIKVPLNLGYRPREIEEIGVVKYVIDYSYIKNVPSGKSPDGTTLYNQEISREKFNGPSRKVFFVRSE